MASKMASCIFCKIVKGMFFSLLPRTQAPPKHQLTRLPSTGEIPSFKLFESEKTLAFLDIQPLSRGHAVRDLTKPPKSLSTKCDVLYLTNTVYQTQLVIPKVHGEKLTDIPDDHLTELLVRHYPYLPTSPPISIAPRPSWRYLTRDFLGNK